MAHLPFEPERFLSHAAHVRELARRLVYDVELAREVEQETWLAALHHGARDVREPRAWLGRIARNVAQRLGTRRTLRLDVEAACARTSDEEGSDFDLDDRERALRAVLAAVARLPEKVRATIVLHYLDGLTLRAVAQRQNTPLETVRSRAKRGLALLRADLAHGRELTPGWALGIVRALDLTPPWPSSTSGWPLAWMTSMSTSLKFALAATVVGVALGAGWLAFALDRPARPGARGSSTAPPELSVRLATASESDPGPGSGPAQPDRPDRRIVPAQASLGAPATTGGLLVDVAWARDGRAASGVPIWIDRQDGTKRGSTAVESSLDGRVRLESLRPGTYAVQSALGGRVFVDVPAGEPTRLRLEIPLGRQVRGRVVDFDGRPFAGAEVFLWPGGLRPQFEGEVIARSDERGEFELPSLSVQVNGSLSARAARRAPTAQVLLTGSAGSVVELELRFEQPGRALGGRVVDVEGRPVEGAEVLIGVERDVVMHRLPDGRFRFPPIGQLVRTDADGRFEVLGAPFDTSAVQVRAPGRAPWRGEWLADGPEWLDIRLEPGARVFGVVRDARAAPVEYALIRCGPPIAFASLYTKSAADGSYSLGALAPGRVELICETANGDVLREPLELTAGELRRWDPLPAGGRELRGRVDASELASADDFAGRWYVRARSTLRAARGGTGYAETVDVDEQGRFQLRQVPREEIDVALGVRGSGFYVARATGVAVDAEPLVLRPEPERLPTATLVGRLVGPDGRPLASADVWARHTSFGSALVHPAADGSFEHGPLPAGDWTLEVDAATAGWSILRTTVALDAWERRDAGTLGLGPGGFAAVSLVGASPTTPKRAVRAEVWDAAGRTVSWLAFEAGQARSLPLTPGEYSLVFDDPDAFEPAQPRFVVNAGLETALEVRWADSPLAD